MSKRCEQAFHKKKCTDGKITFEKMFTTISWKKYKLKAQQNTSTFPLEFLKLKILQAKMQSTRTIGNEIQYNTLENICWFHRKQERQTFYSQILLHER